MSFPVTALAVLGIVIAVLGLFGASPGVMVIGLASLVVAGLLEILGRTRARQSETNQSKD